MLFVFILLGARMCSALQCSESLPTIRYVPSCPTDKASWKIAEAEKKCHHIAGVQRCTEPSQFRYHCLLNSFKNATLDVCAPTRYAQGFCSNFNALQSEVGEDHDADCTAYENPCPKRYLSNETFLYTLCFKLVENGEKRIDENKTTFASNYTVYKNTSSTTEGTVHHSGNTEMVPWLATVVVLSTILIIMVAVYFSYHFGLKQFMGRRGPKVLYSKYHKQALENNVEVMNLMEQIDSNEEIERGHADKFLPFTLNMKPLPNVGRSDDDILEQMAQENERESKTYIEHAREDDQYFEETKVYKEIENTFSKHNIVILTGPPGFGKTKTAIHLVMHCKNSFDETWVFRKINFYTDLAYIERERNTLVFIDDIFDGNEKFTAHWMTVLDKVNVHARSMTGKPKTLGKIKVIITAKGNAVDEACKTMKKRSIFREECVVNMANPSYTLDGEEKQKILRKKFQHANIKKGMPPPKLPDQFWTKIYQTNDAHIGFPLCAHLFAFEEEYRVNGADFFSSPTPLVSRQIQEVVKSDKTHRSKTLFLLLFLQKVNSRKIDIRHKRNCERFLQRECQLQHYFEPLNFKHLNETASNLTWSFVKKENDGVFQFIHESVFASIEKYFFQTLPALSICLFPLDVINRQTRDTTWMTNENFECIVQRFINDVQHGMSAQVCECNLLKTTEFAKRFIASINSPKHCKKKIFLSKQSSCQPCLPIPFWLGKNAVIEMNENLFNLIDEQDGEITAENYLYLGLFGECMHHAETHLPHGDTENIYSTLKKRVLKFQDEEENTIFHFVVQSKHGDRFAARVIRQMIKDKGKTEDVSGKTLPVNFKNSSGETALMVAVRCKQPREKVVMELVKGGCDINLKDRYKFTVLHHCVSADVDDITCAERMKIVLANNKDMKLAIDNIDGQTALNLACMNKRHSRIMSICCLLRYGDFTEYVNKIDLNGNSPIFNAVSELSGADVLVEMERLLRVCILLLHECKPRVRSDVKDESPVDVCSRNGYNDVKAIITQYPSQDKMISILNEQLRKVSAIYTANDDIKIDIRPDLTDTEDVIKAIRKSVQFMAKKSLPLAS